MISFLFSLILTLYVKILVKNSIPLREFQSLYQRKRVIMKAFITSQFSYCPLVWMCHSITLKNKQKKLHERALRLVYDDR